MRLEIKMPNFIHKQTLKGILMTQLILSWIKCGLSNMREHYNVSMTT
ncbi:hypothetical protein MAR_008407 [Mya arenaria]|uniref:Uncharacterized protein n=1 Tax=Mya arenaria TaxID=6604 RepID=A0ABY7E0B1_MYAAR|nr:hypothetical protein MAR_008407 [Mya arenaria]